MGRRNSIAESFSVTERCTIYTHAATGCRDAALSASSAKDRNRLLLRRSPTPSRSLKAAGARLC